MVRPWEPCEPRASTSNALYGSAAVDLQRALCKGHRDRTAANDGEIEVFHGGPARLL
jgi:hypothetical protein